MNPYGKIDPAQPALFQEMNKPSKIREFEDALSHQVLSRCLLTNKAVYEFVLERGMLASHARDALKRMIETGDIPKQQIHVSYDAWAKPGLPETIVLKGASDERRL